MNLLGTFSFGRVIKTFLPGFVILFAVTLFTETIIRVLHPSPTQSLWEFLSQNSVLTSFIAIPLSLICGIFSNMALFVFFTDAIIRGPFKRGNEEFFQLQTQIFDKLYKVISDSNTLPRKLAHAFRNSEALDMEYLLLPIVPVEKLLFLQESYWYYLEFQLNMSLATVLLAIGGISWSLSNFSMLGISWASYVAATCLGAFFTAFLVILSLKAARRNYARHIQKLLNLLLGSVVFRAQAEESDFDHLGTESDWPETEDLVG